MTRGMHYGCDFQKRLGSQRCLGENMNILTILKFLLVVHTGAYLALQQTLCTSGRLIDENNYINIKEKVGGDWLR